MELSDLIQAAAIAAVGVASAFFAMWILSRRPRWNAPRRNAPRRDGPQPETAFLFEGDDLVDASPAARRLMDALIPQGSDKDRLVAFLTRRFQDLPAQLGRLGDGAAVELTSARDGTVLSLDRRGSKLRFRLSGVRGRHSAQSIDNPVTDALSDELSLFRRMADTAPFPLWRQTAKGGISWANAEYLRCATDTGKAGSTEQWPGGVFQCDPVPRDGKSAAQTCVLRDSTTDERHWFECHSTMIDDEFMVVAQPVDRAVRAERKARELVQTLSQTFAHLSVGLAVFDQQRELTLFNPALVDLTELQPTFLVTRPSLIQVFDKLRDGRVMPEPKDYKSWRRQVTALDTAAADGVFRETWSLFDGRTFRVTGRPQPQGAVVFLFEDISAEISMTQKLRSELQTGQAVIDALDEAVAVFSPAGDITMWNRAYAEMWYGDDNHDLAGLKITTASRRWQKSCVPTPVWGDARDFAVTLGERENWTADARLRDGRALACRFDALPGGNTLVGFAAMTQPSAPDHVAPQQAARA